MNYLVWANISCADKQGNSMAVSVEVAASMSLSGDFEVRALGEAPQSLPPAACRCVGGGHAQARCPMGCAPCTLTLLPVPPPLKLCARRLTMSRSRASASTARRWAPLAAQHATQLFRAGMLAILSLRRRPVVCSPTCCDPPLPPTTCHPASCRLAPTWTHWARSAAILA